MNLSQFRLPLTLTAPLAIAALLSACGGDDPEETTAAVATNTTGGSTTASTAATNTSSTSGSGGAASTASATVTSTTGEGLDCTMKQTIVTGTVIDFEGYDGTTLASEFQFNFNGDEAGNGAVYAGLWELSDLTGAYALSLISGAEGSTWAASASNDSAADWGGGFGIWSGCMDASAFTGIQFWVNATTPAATAGLSMGIGGDLQVSAKFNIAAAGEWTLVQLPFTSFASDPAGDTTDGSSIGNFVFAAHMNYAQDAASGEWLPQPGAFSVAVDNIGFY